MPINAVWIAFFLNSDISMKFAKQRMPFSGKIFISRNLNTQKKTFELTLTDFVRVGRREGMDEWQPAMMRLGSDKKHLN